MEGNEMITFNVYQCELSDLHKILQTLMLTYVYINGKLVHRLSLPI